MDNLQNRGHVLVLMEGMVVSNVTNNLKRKLKIVKPRYITADSFKSLVIFNITPGDFVLISADVEFTVI